MDPERVREMVGLRIRALREAEGLSILAFSQISTVSPVHISLVERGKKSVSIDVLAKLANALQKPVGVFFETVPPPFRRGSGGCKTQGVQPERLGLIVQGLATGCDDDKIRRFEIIARAYFGERRPKRKKPKT